MEATPEAEIVDEAPTSELDADALDTVLSAFDARFEELQWRENEDGVLFVAEENQLSMIARVELSTDDYEAALADADEVDVTWSELSRVPAIGQKREEQTQD